MRREYEIAICKCKALGELERVYRDAEKAVNEMGLEELKKEFPCREKTLTKIRKNALRCIEEVWGTAVRISAI
jgi:hypothetical protein